MKVAMTCRKCGVDYEVEYQGEQIWGVGDTSLVRGIDAEPEAETQAGVFPRCLDSDCLGVLRPEDER